MSSEIIEAFASESMELFDAIDEAIRLFDGSRAEAIASLFRSVHTLKGSAGIVGLARLESFAHAWESRLAKLRSADVLPAEGCVEAFLSCRERLKFLIEEAEPSVGAEGEGEVAELRAEDLSVLARLDAALRPAEPASAAPAAALPAGLGAESAAESAPRTAAAPEPAAPGPGSPAQPGHSGLEVSYSRVANAKLEAILAEATEIAQVVSELGREAAAAGGGRLVEIAGTVQAMAAKLYRSVLETRMVPFGDIAERYRRAVTEIARASRKNVRFVLLGAETEIDKALADRLAEPLLHLVRNAADHGIESREERRARGKPEGGTVTLSARRDVGSLVVRVEDDGQGVDPELIKERATEQGLLATGAAPTVDELLELLFRPGFSLSKKLTRWSGRGVGLDAVDRAVRALRGVSRLETRPGRGFVSEIRLPLALSLAEGFQARAGEVELLVPYEAVKACFEFDDHGRRGPFEPIPVDGRLLPGIDLSEVYGGAGERAARRIAIVVAAEGSEAVILVDEVGRTLSAPVRPIDRRLADSPGVAGTAVLGDGSLVLVLDAPGLVRLAARGGLD